MLGVKSGRFLPILADSMASLALQDRASPGEYYIGLDSGGAGRDPLSENSKDKTLRLEAIKQHPRRTSCALGRLFRSRFGDELIDSLSHSAGVISNVDSELKDDRPCRSVF